MLFVRSAVLRKDPGCSFDLVTPGVRGNVSRREWAAGQLPFQRFTYGDPDRLTARIVPRVTLPRTFGSWLVLHDGDGKEHVFELILVRTGERWLVDYWAPVVGLGDSA